MSQPKNEQTGYPVIWTGIVSGTGYPSCLDPSGLSSSKITSFWQGPFSPLFPPLTPGVCSMDPQDHRTQYDQADPGGVSVNLQAGSGLTNAIPVGKIRAFNMPAAIPGTVLTNVFENSAIPPVGMPLPNIAGPTDPPIEEIRTGSGVKKPQYRPFITNQHGTSIPMHPTHGKPYSEKGHKWQQHKGIPTATAAFASIMNLAGMIAGLAGSAISTKNTFSSLSNTQQQQIKANTTPEVYEIIKAHFSTATDIAETEGSITLTGRVHQETFANNMVSLLCNCKSYVDVIDCMQRLKSDPVLQGKDKIPVQEFPIASMFGQNGLIIDGYGDSKLNVSPQAAAAESTFMSYLKGDVASVVPVAAFYGRINANTLTVSSMVFGDIKRGANNIISGLDVASNTYVVSYGTGTGFAGTYTVNQPSNTYPNTYMTILGYAQKSNNANQQPGGGGGGGGGAMPIGMVPGMNFFGQAAQLIGEVLPTLSPGKGAALASMINAAGQPPSVIPGNLATFAGRFPRIPPAPGIPLGQIMSTIQSAIGMAAGAMAAGSSSSVTQIPNNITYTPYNAIGNTANG